MFLLCQLWISLFNGYEFQPFQEGNFKALFVRSWVVLRLELSGHFVNFASRICAVEVFDFRYIDIGSL